MTLEAWVYPTATTGGWTDVIYKGPDDIYYLMASTGAGSSPPATGWSFAGPLFGTSALPLNAGPTWRRRSMGALFACTWAACRWRAGRSCLRSARRRGR